ncbi:MAG: hypothetical protein ACLQIQ_16940, partial [Beijerinckiaceae bacterium]
VSMTNLPTGPAFTNIASGESVVYSMRSALPWEFDRRAATLAIGCYSSFFVSRQLEIRRGGRMQMEVIKDRRGQQAKSQVDQPIHPEVFRIRQNEVDRFIKDLRLAIFTDHGSMHERPVSASRAHNFDPEALCVSSNFYVRHRNIAP